MAEEKTKRRKRESSIPNFPEKDATRGVSSDSLTIPVSPTTRFEAFQTSGVYIGTGQSYGGSITSSNRLFYSLREPVGHWWIVEVANDIWDNWFKVKDTKKPDDNTLNDQVQPVLEFLKAKVQFPRETVFERRYGTSILLLSYTGFNNDWGTPLYELDSFGRPPDSLSDASLLLQMTPFPWTSVTKVEVDRNPSSLRFGLPEYYTIERGSTVDSASLPFGETVQSSIRVHWTRVIHDAPRLDEHPYEGLSAIDPIFDDLVGGRNARWGMYQTIFRYGSGFPVIKTLGTKAENEAWITSGGLDTYLNTRGYIVMGKDEEFTFAGAQGTALNPTSYFDTYFTYIAAATGVAQDTIKGVSAGRVTGSEVNERQYFKSISLQQHKKEPILRELIDRLIQTGQIEFSGDYIIEWIDPFEINPQDHAAIEFLKVRTNTQRLAYMTQNEVRERSGENLKDLGEEGEVITGLPGQFGGMPNQGGAPNQQAPERQPTEPESPIPADSLFDKVLEDAAK